MNNIKVDKLCISLIFLFYIHITSSNESMIPDLDMLGLTGSPDDEYCGECGMQQKNLFVFNGKKVDDTAKYPWIVSLIEKSNPDRLFCGGMLISRQFLITAGHCVDMEEKRTDKECAKEKASKKCFRPTESLYVGLLHTPNSNDVKRVEVKGIVPHPKYNTLTFAHDIAVVELKKALKCEEMAKPICLPYKNLSKMGQTLIIAGWGKYDDNEKSKQMLMEGKVQEITESMCALPMDETRNIICAVGNETYQSSCQGDSGSAIFAPFESEYFAMGVTSIGPSDCNSQHPDSYTDIYSYLPWIKSVANDLPKSVGEKEAENVGKKSRKEGGIGRKRKVGTCTECGLPPTTPKIMGGTKVERSDKYSWIVSFIDMKEKSVLYCGGVIISSTFVLTAAHCVDDLDMRDLDVCKGKTMPKQCYRDKDSFKVGILVRRDTDIVMRKKVKRVIPHPKYNPESHIHDIALVEVEREINCHKIARPICLPHKDLSKINQTLIISGWGKYDRKKDSKQMLMEGTVTQIEEKNCIFPLPEERKIICARGIESNQASCQGDSGTAIFMKGEGFPQYFAVGITSVGPDNCTSSEPDSYSDVFRYMSWIKKHVKDYPLSRSEREEVEKEEAEEK